MCNLQLDFKLSLLCRVLFFDILSPELAISTQTHYVTVNVNESSDI